MSEGKFHPPEQVPQLSESDKLYLLLVKHDLSGCFNQLCYLYNVRSVADLERLQKNGWSAELMEGAPELHGGFIDGLDNLIRGAADADFSELYFQQSRAGKLDNFEVLLREAAVPVIRREDLVVKSIIAQDCPCSGNIYLAQWTRPDASKITVCLQCDILSEQRTSFLKEAKLLTRCRHAHIIGLYGAVVLGCCVQSLALVTEYAQFGNLEEQRVDSIHSAWLYSVQVASALAYLEDQELVYGALMEPFIMVFSSEKVKIKGLAYCYTQKEVEEATRVWTNEGLETLLHFQEGLPVPFSRETVICTFGDICKHMFQMIPKTLPVWHQLSREKQVFSGSAPKPMLCPKNILSILTRCSAEDPDERPTFNEIAENLAKERPARVRTTQGYQKRGLHEMPYSPGEEITVISKSPKAYKGFWFGQKDDGLLGYFNPDHTVRTDDDDNVPPEIKARGPEARHAYRTALLEGKVQVRRARLMLIGQDRAGKTSLKKSLLGLPFDSEEPSTDGIKVDASRLEIEVDRVRSADWKPACEQPESWDKEMAKLVAQLLPKESQSPGEPQRPQTEAAPSDAEPSVTEETTAKGHRIAEQAISNGFFADETDGPGMHKRTSRVPPAKVPENVASFLTEILKEKRDEEREDIILDVWDFAGQHLYYASHPFFFTRRAIYLLVHNLSKPLHSRADPCVKQGAQDPRKLDNHAKHTNLDMLLSWLVSVHSIRKSSTDAEESENGVNVEYERPPVVLVGTHANDVDPLDVRNTQRTIQELLSSRTYGEHVIGEHFAVDNKDGREVASLRAKVEALLRGEPYVKVMLPVKWLKFEKTVKRKSDEENVRCMTLEQVKRVARDECFIRDENQLEVMLNFFHDLGVIVRHRNTVVLQSRWLIELFRKLITIRPYELQGAKYRKYWKALEEQGILHEELIGPAFRELTNDMETKEDMLAMMEEYGLVAKFPVSRQTGRYFVPAQLTSSPETLQKQEPRPDDPCVLFIHFLDGFVPQGLFTHLTSRLIRHSASLDCTQLPNLYSNGVRFVLGTADQFDLILLCGQRFIKVLLQCSVLDASDLVTSAVMTSLPIQVRGLLEKTLLDLKAEHHWLGNMEYETSVRCGVCDKSCKTHGVSSCPRDECLHFVPVGTGRRSMQFTCGKRFGDRARFTVPGFKSWFLLDTSPGCSPVSTMKTGCPSGYELMSLARDIIGLNWRCVGRALGLEDPDLNQIEADESGSYERCYGMLQKWHQTRASDATYENLARALRHETVERLDLVQKYCEC